MQAFEPYIALNSHVRKPVIHISLNPSPKDILSEEQMTILAQEFMEKFGYGNQPYIVWLHEDIDRKHVHIVSVRINEKGEKIDHNREAVRAQNICREMEVKYGLHPTLGEHGERELLALQKVDYPKGDVKAQAKHTARTLLECYNCHSLGEYNTLLNLYNITVYEVRGSVDGKEYHGIMYGALDDNGQQVGTPFKSRKFGKVFGYEALQKKFAASAEKGQPPRKDKAGNHQSHAGHRHERRFCPQAERGGYRSGLPYQSRRTPVRHHFHRPYQSDSVQRLAFGKTLFCQCVQRTVQ